MPAIRWASLFCNQSARIGRRQLCSRLVNDQTVARPGITSRASQTLCGSCVRVGVLRELHAPLQTVGWPNNVVFVRSGPNGSDDGFRVGGRALVTGLSSHRSGDAGDSEHGASVMPSVRQRRGDCSEVLLILFIFCSFQLRKRPGKFKKIILTLHSDLLCCRQLHGRMVVDADPFREQQPPLSPCRTNL